MLAASTVHVLVLTGVVLAVAVSGVGMRFPFREDLAVARPTVLLGRLLPGARPSQR